jgi:hypothetical protein
MQTTKTLLENRVADAEAESCWRAGTGIGVAQPPEFDGSSSWAVFRRQFETVAQAQYNGWTAREKALHESAAHILNDVPTGDY